MAVVYMEVRASDCCIWRSGLVTVVYGGQG